MKIPPLSKDHQKKLVHLTEELYNRMTVNFDEATNRIELSDPKGEITYRAHWFIFCTQKLVKDIHGESEINYNETNENLTQNHKETVAEIIKLIDTVHPVDILTNAFNALR